ncbi:hypothetical protein WDU94_006454 [Cyamophila willieti]
MDKSTTNLDVSSVGDKTTSLDKSSIMDKSTAGESKPSSIPKPKSGGLGVASGVGSASSSTSSLAGVSGMKPPSTVSKIARSCANPAPKPGLPPSTPQALVAGYNKLHYLENPAFGL